MLTPFTTALVAANCFAAIWTIPYVVWLGAFSPPKNEIFQPRVLTNESFSSRPGKTARNDNLVSSTKEDFALVAEKPKKELAPAVPAGAY